MLSLGINGFGRIGPSVLRALMQSHYASSMQVVAINEPGPLETIAHLIRYDSTHGPWRCDIDICDGGIRLDGQFIRISHHTDLKELDWQGLDLVLECTGEFQTREHAAIHLANGAPRVLFSQPGSAALDATVVYGLNQSLLKPEHTMASSASCTTNAVAPIIDILHRAIGINSGVITTIHSAMNDQPVIDAYHNTDLRKTRSAIRSVIPVDTGLARGIDRILPELTGLFEAQAMRVPTIDVSAIDLSISLKQHTSPETLNQLLVDAAASAPYQGIVGVSFEPLASCDYLGETRSAVVDASQTRVAGGNLAKLLIWFDNEWGYANRMLDVANHWLSGVNDIALSDKM